MGRNFVQRRVGPTPGQKSPENRRFFTGPRRPAAPSWTPGRLSPRPSTAGAGRRNIPPTEA